MPKNSSGKRNKRGTGTPLMRPAPKPPLLARLRTDFLAGLVIVAPVVITAYLAWTFVNFVDNSVLPLVPARYRPDTYLPFHVPGLGLIVFIVFTTFIGALAKNIIGRTVLRWGESILHRMPVVRTIYNAAKQIAETVFSQSQTSFQQACLIEYPRRGIWAIGFVSTETGGEVGDKAHQDDLLSIFLPTTPNPTSGFLLFVPKSDVMILDMTVEQAAKLVISAGLVETESAPNNNANKAIAPSKPNPDST